MAKNDEFYTLIGTVEDELKHYTSHFKNRIVFCNCDDPKTSNFWRFFTAKFHDFGLKKVIATHYRPSTLFESAPAYKIEYEGAGEPELTWIEGDGDFRSPECTNLLEEADIVVTNPPFSLFREYVAQLVEYDKKFLVIGNMNATIYKEIFPLIKNEKVWLGCTPRSGGIEFKVDDDYEGKTSRIDEEGNKYTKMGFGVWFTNLSHNQRNESIILYKSCASADYPAYDNYPAIEVSKVKEIPMDYDGEMGVPISFLTRYNPNQFEIVGDCSSLLKNDKRGRFYLGGKRLYSRIVIKRKEQSK